MKNEGSAPMKMFQVTDDNHFAAFFLATDEKHAIAKCLEMNPDIKADYEELYDDEEELETDDEGEVLDEQEEKDPNCGLVAYEIADGQEVDNDGPVDFYPINGY